MRTLICAAAIFVFNVLDGRAAIPSILDSAIHPTTGHQYFLLGNSDWLQAEAAAISLGGHLVTINDQAENDWIHNLWGTGRSLWIGFSDAAVEGTFTWASGEPVTFTNWNTATGEPNDGVGWGRPSEDYAYMIAAGFGAASGKWNDYTSVPTIGGGQSPLYGVVEVVPEPTVTTILFCGSLLLARFAGVRARKV